MDWAPAYAGIQSTTLCFKVPVPRPAGCLDDSRYGKRSYAFGFPFPKGTSSARVFAVPYEL